MMFAGNFAPRGWAFCDGQLLPISSNSALFSLIGTTYGGDGRTTFGLPDLRGRVSIHPGNGPGLTSRRWGDKGGVEAVTLNVSEMPAHAHSVQMRAESRPGNSPDPVGKILASGSNIFRDNTPKDDVIMDAAAVTESSVGGNLGHTNMQPFTAIYHIIALQGIFPSRS